MCTGIEIALIVAGTALSAGASIYQGVVNADLAQMEADSRDKQLAIQNKQLEEDRRLAQVQATQQENERQRQARRLRAQNESYIAAAGIAANISYQQGIDPANEKALKYDIANLRLTSKVQRGRMLDQIAVNRLESQFNRQAADLRSQSALVTGFAEAGSDIIAGAYKGYYLS
jgi:hypothetical protein